MGYTVNIVTIAIVSYYKNNSVKKYSFGIEEYVAL